jgi:ATP-dependent protease HslVU (ClpYQ), peptidase subunit
MLLLSGNGDVIEPDEPVLAIGSGGDYARSAALALYRNTDFDARKIVEEAMKIAGEVCIYTNQNFVIEEIE